MVQKDFINRQTLKYYRIFWKIKKEKSKTITVQIFLKTPSPLASGRYFSRHLQWNCSPPDKRASTKLRVKQWLPLIIL